MQNKKIGYIEYRTRQYDTFDLLSLAAYNEEKMSSEIIAVNPDYADVLIFDEGVDLLIPIFEQTETSANMPPWRV